MCLKDTYLKINLYIAALSLFEGRAVLTFDRGYGAVWTTTVNFLLVNQVSEVTASVSGSVGRVSLNGGLEAMVTDTVPAGGNLTLSSLTYIGGVPRTVYVPGSIPTADGELTSIFYCLFIQKAILQQLNGI